MSEPLAEPLDVEGAPAQSWWSIHSFTIMEMLYEVHRGRSPESVYVQFHNMSRSEEPHSDQ